MGQRQAPGKVDIAFDWSKPDAVRADGTREYAVRCRAPFELNCTGDFRVVPVTSEAMPVRDGMADELDPKKYTVIEGLASSTSQDFYGTEMSSLALQSMAAQFQSGVAYVPTHWESEWHQVIGRTFNAAVMPAEVIKPAGRGEQGFVLRVGVRLDLSHELSRELIRRLDAAQPIGQSIGGWFTQIRVITGDDGAIERMIVEEVELDHLAVTRSPANPDSWIMPMRTAIREAVIAARSKATHAIEDAPGYRPTVDNATEACGTCRHFTVDAVDPDVGRCNMYAFTARAGAVRSHNVCDSYMAPAESTRPVQAQRGVQLFADLPLVVCDDGQDDEPWTFTAEDQDAILGRDADNWPEFARAHVWVDAAMEPSDRAAYKLPIAKLYRTEEEGSDNYAPRLSAYLTGVSAAMTTLLAGGGGVPESDRAAVYDHLVKYYEKARIEPPENTLARGTAMQVRKVPGSKSLPLADKAMAWSFDTAEADAVLGDPPDWSKYASAHAWQDPDADAKTKGAYKLPFAKLVDGKLSAVWRGVAAAMSVLNGGRGGVAIPDADKEHVHAFLASYYEKFDETPPDLKSVSVSTDGPETSSDSSTQADGRASAPDATTTTEEVDMTPEQIAALAKGIADGLAPQFADLSAKVGALAERQAPAAPTTAVAQTTTTEAARARPAEITNEADLPKAVRDRLAAQDDLLKRQERVIQKLAATPARRGQHPSGSEAAVSSLPDASSELKQLSKDCREHAPAMAAVVTDGIADKLTAGTYGFQNADGTYPRPGAVRSQLQTILSSAINAAIADGEIVPDRGASWK